jgi:hypothetical protein
MITGSSYLERGKPVVALIQWRQQRKTERLDLLHVHTGTSTPRNVTVCRADGSTATRPFRGLRRAAGGES